MVDRVRYDNPFSDHETPIMPGSASLKHNKGFPGPLVEIETLPARKSRAAKQNGGLGKNLGSGSRILDDLHDLNRRVRELIQRDQG